MTPKLLPSLVCTIKNQRFLEIDGSTTSGTTGDSIDIAIPADIVANDIIIGSTWYRLDEITIPAAADVALVLSGVSNSIGFGWAFSGGGGGTSDFFVERGASRFQTAAIDITSWTHMYWYIDFLTPANSQIYANGVLQTLDTTPSTSSLSFTPLSASISLDGTSNVADLSHVYVSPSDKTQAQWLKQIVPRLSSNKKPSSLGKRGGLAHHTLPWVYLSFFTKDGTDGLYNDSTQEALTITFAGDISIINASLDPGVEGVEYT